MTMIANPRPKKTGISRNGTRLRTQKGSFERPATIPVLLYVYGI
jgi:hypothetical protein